MCERVRRQIGSAGVYRVRVSERVWVKAKSAAGIGLRGCWRGSELNGHPRGHEHEPRRERGVCREDARCFGREVLGGCRCRRRRVVVVALCPALSQSHTHARTLGGGRRKTNAASDACEEGRPEHAGYAGGPAAVHERDGSPLRRSNHGDSSFSISPNGPVGAGRIPYPYHHDTLDLKPSCGAAVAYSA